jgi:hypothetical protein
VRERWNLVLAVVMTSGLPRYAGASSRTSSRIVAPTARCFPRIEARWYELVLLNGQRFTIWVTVPDDAARLVEEGARSLGIPESAIVVQLAPVTSPANMTPIS